MVVLELSEPQRGPLAALARFHIHRVVPRLGSALSGSNEYAYLQRSIAAFPAPELFASTMFGGGLRVLEVAPMSFGAVCLFVATPRRSAP